MSNMKTTGCDESQCGTLPQCAGCTLNKKREVQAPVFAQPHTSSRIKKVIGVVSGKGGVGKSMTTCLLAVALQKRGYKVGILDADITGPSVPRAFGIKQRAGGDDQGILPVYTDSGIAVMSINLILDQENSPVIWRGSLLGSAVKQFWTDVVWGELDVLLIDMPPGTGDVPLTVYQSIPLDGVVLVTSPQDLVSMIVEKAAAMARQMQIPILGMVENMAYLNCPDCGRRIALFGSDSTAQLAMKIGVPLLAQLPLDPELAAMVDTGRVEATRVSEMRPALAVILSMLGL